MKRFVVTAAAVAGLFVAASSFAQSAPAGAPAGSTGLCKDGTYTSTPAKRGACHGHKGVQDWYAAAAAPGGAASASAAAPATATAPAAKPAQPATTPATAKAARQAAPGGGNGQVWVNTSTKVYHCEGDRAYGKTKQGQYMTEAAAKAAGDRPSHGKACTAG